MNRTLPSITAVDMALQFRSDSSQQMSQNPNLSSFRFYRCRPATAYLQGARGESSVFGLFSDVVSRLYTNNT